MNIRNDERYGWQDSIVIPVVIQNCRWRPFRSWNWVCCTKLDPCYELALPGFFTRRPGESVSLLLHSLAVLIAIPFNRYELRRNTSANLANTNWWWVHVYETMYSTKSYKNWNVHKLILMYNINYILLLILKTVFHRSYPLLLQFDPSPVTSSRRRRHPLSKLIVPGLL